MSWEVRSPGNSMTRKCGGWCRSLLVAVVRSAASERLLWSRVLAGKDAGKRRVTPGAMLWSPVAQDGLPGVQYLCEEWKFI